MVIFFIYKWALPLQFFILSSSILFSSYALATCEENRTSQAESVRFGDIVIPSDAAIGSVIKEVVGNSYDEQIRCGNPGIRFNADVGIFSSATSIEGVYKTNIEGVGISVKVNGQYIPFSRSLDNNAVYYFSNPIIQLVKYGPTGSGNLSTGRIATLSYSSLRNILRIQNVLSGTIRSPSCTLNNNIANVPMGSLSAISLNSIGSRGPEKKFILSLNCYKSTKVTMKINGTTDKSSSVLAITKTQKSASGVGVEISFNQNPIIIGNSFDIDTAQSDGILNIPLSARYIKTASTIMAGEANATATFTLIYN